MKISQARKEIMRSQLNAALLQQQELQFKLEDLEEEIDLLKAQRKLLEEDIEGYRNLLYPGV